MRRRDFFKTSLAATAMGLVPPSAPLRAAAPDDAPKAPGLTKYVAGFILNTKYEDIPAEVIELGKKSILDGFGLALAGSVAETGPIVERYLKTFGFGPAKASIIGTAIKVPLRFAAFANGVSIHAHDYDDTQLSVAEDRVYG